MLAGSSQTDDLSGHGVDISRCCGPNIALRNEPTSSVNIVFAEEIIDSIDDGVEIPECPRYGNIRFL